MKRNKSMFLKTFMGVCCIAFTVMFTMTAICFWILQREMSKEYQRLTDFTLSNADVVFCQYMNETENMVKNWYYSRDGVECRTVENYEIVEHMRFVNSAQQTMQNIPYIQSLYLYNKNRECTAAIGSRSAAYVESLEVLLMERLRGQEGLGYYFSLDTQDRYGAGGQIPLLSVYYQEAPVGGRYYAGTVAVVLDCVVLGRSIFSQINAEQYVLSILDATGRVIVSSRPENCGQDWTARIDGQKDVGSERLAEDHAWRYTMISSEKQGFYLIAQTKKELFPEGISAFSGFLFVGLCLLSLVIVILTTIVCNLLYKPFYDMISDLKKTGGVGAAPGKEMLQKEKSRKEETELQFLRNFYLQMSERISVLHEKAEEDFFVKNLLLKNEHSGIQSILISNGIVYAGKGYYLILVYLSDTEETDHIGMKEYDKRRQLVSSLYLASLKDTGKCIGFELGLRRLLLIVSETEEGQIEEQELFEALESAHRTTREITGKGLITLVSERISDGEETCVLVYQILDDSLRIQQLTGNENVLLRKNKEQMIYPRRLEREILQAARKRDLQKYLALIGRFLEEGRQCTYHTFLCWLTALCGEIISGNPAFLLKEPERSGLLEHYREQLGQMQSRREVDMWFGKLYQQAVPDSVKVDSFSTTAVMEQAVDYIRYHYDDTNLNVGMLAEKFHISAAYFGRLFRDFAGVSVSEYLTKLRLENACLLLTQNPKMEIAQVGERVGFPNPSYFTTIFKKTYGISPSKFRSCYLASQ